MFSFSFFFLDLQSINSLLRLYKKIPQPDMTTDSTETTTSSITTQQSNTLGKPNTASIPKLHKLWHVDPVTSSSASAMSHPLPDQAMALKTYEMASYGLKRINEKANQMYQLKINLEIIHVLVTSLDAQQIGFALQSLGMFDIDHLFHVLFEETRLHVSSKSSVEGTSSDIVRVITVVLMEKPNELVTNVNMISDFLILYSSGMIYQQSSPVS